MAEPEEPDREALKEKIDGIKTQIEQLHVDIRTVETERKNVPKRNTQRETEVLRRSLNRINRELRQELAAKDAIMRKIRESETRRRDLFKQHREMQRDNEYQTSEDVDGRIRQLETKLETMPNSTLKKEQRIMNQIRDLNRVRDTVVKELSDVGVTMDEARVSQRRQLEEAMKRQEKLEALRAKRDEFTSRMNNTQLYEDEERDSLLALDQRRSTLLKEIDDHHKEIRAARDEYQKAVDAWHEWQDQKEREAQEKAEKQRLERLERKREVEEERKRRRDEDLVLRQIEKEEQAADPYRHQIDLCGSLVEYLVQKQRRVAPPPARAQRTPRATPKVSAAREVAGGKPGWDAPREDGLTVYKKDDDESDKWLYSDRTKKGPGKAPKMDSPARVPQDVKLTVEKFQSFTELGIPIPVLVTELGSAIDAVRKKKAWYERDCNGSDPFPVANYRRPQGPRSSSRGGGPARGRGGYPGRGRGRSASRRPNESSGAEGGAEEDRGRPPAERASSPGGRGGGRGGGDGPARGRGRSRNRRGRSSPGMGAGPVGEEGGEMGDGEEAPIRPGRGRGRGGRAPEVAVREDDESAPVWTGRGRGRGGRGGRAPAQAEEDGEERPVEVEGGRGRGRARRGRGRGPTTATRDVVDGEDTHDEEGEKGRDEEVDVEAEGGEEGTPKPPSQPKQRRWQIKRSEPAATTEATGEGEPKEGEAEEKVAPEEAVREVEEAEPAADAEKTEEVEVDGEAEGELPAEDGVVAAAPEDGQDEPEAGDKPEEDAPDDAAEGPGDDAGEKAEEVVDGAVGDDEVGEDAAERPEVEDEPDDVEAAAEEETAEETAGDAEDEADRPDEGAEVITDQADDEGEEAAQRPDEEEVAADDAEVANRTAEDATGEEEEKEEEGDGEEEEANTGEQGGDDTDAAAGEDEPVEGEPDNGAEGAPDAMEDKDGTGSETREEGGAECAMTERVVSMGEESDDMGYGF